LAAQWFLAAAPWAAVLAEPLSGRFRRPRLMLNASGAGFTADSHQLAQGTPAALVG
jgi:hypothetical protein